MKEIELDPETAVEFGLLGEYEGENMYLLNGRPVEIKDKDRFVLDVDEGLGKEMKDAIREAKEAAKAEFIEWLKEKDRISEHATKRQELMMGCTHPETHRIYPDHSVENDYNDDMVWHCTACGYAEFREGEDE